MPIFMLLAIIISMILKYICKLLKLKLLTRFYQELLDRLNITDIIGEITKPKYNNLIFFMPKRARVGAIPKTIIFIDNIEDV